ncbi:MAG: sigma factor-like helix-turn-helix DNA-binding protein [Edaphobacter sp.]
MKAAITDLRANAEDHYIQRETEVRLKDAISHLPMAYRNVIEIRQQSEGSIKEVAAQVGITVAATKSRLMRATKALRNSLSEQEFRSSGAGRLPKEIY